MSLLRSIVGAVEGVDAEWKERGWWLGPDLAYFSRLFDSICKVTISTINTYLLISIEACLKKIKIDSLRLTATIIRIEQSVGRKTDGMLHETATMIVRKERSHQERK